MENFTILSLFSVIGMSIAFLFGGWNVYLTVLSIFMTIEIITRIIKILINREPFTSDALFKHFYRKVTIMLVIILANGLDLLVSNGTPIFRSLAIFYYIGVEGVAIKEHIKATDLTMPDAMLERIEKLKNDNKEDK